MTNEIETGKKSSLSKFMLPIIVVVLAVAALGYFASKDGGIDKQIVEAQLDQWIDVSQQHNPKTRVSYAQVQMQGGATDRHALVQDVRVVTDIVNKEGEPAQLEILFPEVKVQPKSALFDVFDVAVTQGANVDEDGEVTSFAFDPAPVMHVQMDNSDEMQKFQYDLPLSGVWTVTQEDEAKPMLMYFDAASSVTGMGEYGANGHRAGEMELRLPAFKAQAEDADENQLSIANALVNAKWSATEEEQGAATLTLSLQDIFTGEDSMPYGAVSVKIDGDYTGPMPEKKREIDWTSEKALVDLREFSLAAKDVALNAKLSFQTGRGELLPVGEGQIDLKNFAFVLAELRANEMLGAQEEKLLSVLLKRITGQELEELTDLNVPLKRVDGGSLQIGKSSFEDLFTIFLTGGRVGATHEPKASAPAAVAAPVVEEKAPEIDADQVKALFDE